MNVSRKTFKTRLWQAMLPACLLFALGGGIASAAGDPAGARPSTMSLQVDTYRGKADAFRAVELFAGATSRSAASDAVTRLAVSSGTLLDLDKDAVADLQRNRPSTLTLRLPTRERGQVELELFENDIFAPDFQITASGGEDTSKISRGLHYRGIIKGDPSSFAAVSVFNGEVIGTFSTVTDGNWVIGKLEGHNPTNRHIIYAESAILDKSGAPGCAMGTDGARENFAKFWDDSSGSKDTAADQPDMTPVTNGRGAGTDALQTVKCATEWMEAEYDIFQNRGSLQAATDYVTAVFNNSSTLYANDGISLKLQQAYIWTTADPYNGSSSTSNLSSFQSNRASSFTGTIAQLLTFRSLGGGVAAGFSGICNASRSASMCTSGVSAAYNTVPTYSWTVSVVTHEAGHLLGSRHTHACVWNGNNTAIDGCSGQTEGGCPLPGNPSGGGTIMSYCHLTNVGINFNRGFGSQPATVIRNRVEGGGCLANCDGGGGGGGGTLTRGTPLTNQSAATGASLAYTMAVPSGATNLTFTTSGGTGDADLFVRFGSAPTDTVYDCKSEGSTNAETCTIPAPSAGTYHVRLKAYAAFSGLSIVGNYTTGGGGGTQTYSNTTDYAINDNATVDSPITVSGRTGNAPSNASVTVAIVHTYQGDLKVDLVAPDGSLYNIHNRSGGGTDNINKTVQFDLSSEPLNGTWRLRVNDNAANDIGRIDSWSITF